jgi:ATP-dependent DNA helicase DinG
MRAVDLLGPEGPLARAIPGYEHRPSQLRMAEAVETTLADDGVLLVEAGTGTGKTLAYLVPALLAGRRVIVSTGTKTLQDQIMNQDLPALERHLGLEVRAACLKGLDNYLCLRRFDELRSSAAAGEAEGLRHLPMLASWREETSTGDRAELDALEEGSPIWGLVKSGSDTRIGARCAFYEDCFVTRARRRAEEAQLVVVNHHLFFADLATRGPRHKAILPDYDAVVFDEAHAIEDVVTQFFGVSVSTTRIEVLARDAARILSRAGLDHEAGQLVSDALRTGAAFFEALPQPAVVPGAGGGREPLAPGDVAGELLDRMLDLDVALDGLGAFAERKATEGEAVAQLARRAQAIRDDVATIVDGRLGSHVTWTESRGRRRAIGASPVDVSELLREHLFYRTPSVVLTSATLSTGGDFVFVKRRLGIDFDVREERLASPFDYPDQAALYLPPGLPEPRDPAWLDAAAGEVRALVTLTGGGAFVLSTSFRAMRAFHQRCRRELARQGRLVLLQGEAPKGKLLDRFRRDGDAVLFATASFWEGVDVPGDALRLVVLDKLPFEVPSDPIVRARCERLREEGAEPFTSYLVPSAALALKQGFGRLIRGRRDRGVVALLDSRVRRRGYGRKLLDSLPPARRLDRREEVAAFIAETAPGGQQALPMAP